MVPRSFQIPLLENFADTLPFSRRRSNLLCSQLRGTRFNQATECQLLFADNRVGSCSTVATTYVLTDSLGTVALSLVCKSLINLLAIMY